MIGWPLRAGTVLGSEAEMEIAARDARMWIGCPSSLQQLNQPAVAGFGVERWLTKAVASGRLLGAGPARVCSNGLRVLHIIIDLILLL
jgi:hypothetical protein